MKNFKTFSAEEKSSDGDTKEYTDIQVLRECSSCAFRNYVVQLYFLRPTRNKFPDKFLK